MKLPFIEGQLDIFSLLDSTFVPTCPQITAPLTDELYHAERVENLLREVETRGIEYRPCAFFDILSGDKLLGKSSEDAYHYLHNASLRYIRGCWNDLDIASEDSCFSADFFSELAKYVDFSVSFGDQYINNILGYMTKDTGTKSVLLSDINSVGALREIALPLKHKLPKSKHGRLYRLRHHNRYRMVGDAGLLFGQAVLCVQLKEQLQKELTSLSEEDKQDNRLYCYCVEKAQKAHEFLISRRISDNGIIKMPVYLHNLAFVRNALPSDITIKESVTNASYFFYDWLLDGSDTRVPIVFLDSMLSKDIVEAYKTFLDVYEVRKESARNLSFLKQESARVYQTKKNITDKCQKVMKSTLFNKYFGYVEIDDGTDLALFGTIEKQFEALVTLMFGGYVDKDISIRFRLLGRHHAAGLYFPSLKCLCVDVRHPSSLAHEYFHMLDYRHKSVSEGFAFHAVRSRYKELLISCLEKPENSGVKARLSGGTKYNLSYYLTPTEVFARCGEIYLTRICGVDNSLVKPDSECGFAYPADEKLDELIKEFYDKFLAKIKSKEVSAA